MATETKRGSAYATAGLFRLTQLTLLILLLAPAPAFSAALAWHWEDEFSAAERRKLTEWVSRTHRALECFAGPMPFPIEIHFLRRDGAREPVPWANTRRDGRQAIYFHVDTRYPLRDFLDDWTAAHEFTHLLLPYLGRQNSWFAEGFASYLQYTVMVETGAIDAAEARRRRERKMRAATERLADETMALPENAPMLRADRAYPTMYWGAAVYFERVDSALTARGSSLQAVLRKFICCCRLRRRSLDELAATLDSLSATAVFSEELEVIRTTPGFPRRP